MKRRDFLNLSLPATGAIMLAPGLLAASARTEINRQFSGQLQRGPYDLLVNGGGFAGYFAAMHAAKSGKRVLLVERRSALGYELTAKSRFFLESTGFNQFTPDLKQLFTPDGEKPEVHNTRASAEGMLDKELTLMAGSLKKGLLRNVLAEKIDVLLMTDVCGLFADKGKVSGALLATKQGTYAVKCTNFLDASDSRLFSRKLSGAATSPDTATYTLELWNSQEPVLKSIDAPAALGTIGNKIRLHPGKHASHQVFLEFSFDAKGLTIDETEHKARRITEKIGRQLRQLDPTLGKSIIQQLAWECTYDMADKKLPVPALKSHYLLEDIPLRSCSDILKVSALAKKTVKSIGGASKDTVLAQLHLPGALVAGKDITFSEINEPGLIIPLQKCVFDWRVLPGQNAFQVVVAGGGTSGSMVALGALEKGAKTAVFDYFNELGGTKTVAGVMGYYHGYKQQKFFKQQEAESDQLSTAAHMNKKMGRMQYLRTRTLDRNGEFMGRAILCGALKEAHTLKGAVICQDSELKVVKGDVMVDATGDGDLADFAGAAFEIGDSRAGKTQNYSQWDIKGAGKLPTEPNRDYDLLNTTKISELQRGLFLSHYEAHFYDFHPMLALRELRRVKGVYELDALDAVEGTHFEDALVLASSDYDPHYVSVTEFTRCGFILPHSNDVVLEIPYRSIVPEKTDGLLISGRGFSQTHTALQFTRMTADLIVLGYLTGQIAADLAWKGVRPRDYNVSALQKEWNALGYYPEGFFNRPAGNKLQNAEEIRRRITELSAGKREYLYEVIKLPRPQAVSALKAALGSASSEGRVLIAKSLAWFGESQGNELIAEELENLFREETAKGYPADFVDNYDLIRGREKNQLEGLYWRINQDIGLLAMSGNPAYNSLVASIMSKTTSGGPMMTRENAYFDGRIDLKLVPFHNRILNLCFYAERLPDQQFIDPLSKILDDRHVGGYVTKEAEKTRWRVYGGDLELFIAAALARCGGRKGYNLLVDYLGDIHYDFKAFSRAELTALLGTDLRYDEKKWKTLIEGLSFPLKTVKFGKTLEV
ncbi:hypothetical protein GCM10023091_02690 [Ravibacter arvi]|uniref:FAD dependent oxidoreductase n=1 Tax=Ravibacter arvi TaxID=2051041 RepID=A0ABP8LNX8_9BACT